MELFNTRELASITWLSLILGYSFWKAKPWPQLRIVLSTALKPKLLIPFLLISSYTTICVLYLYAWNLWTFAQLKGTLYWYVFGGAWIVFKVATDYESASPLWSYTKGILGISILIEFIAGFKTVHYLIELVIVGTLFFASAIEIISEREEEYAAVNRLSKSILALIGLTILGIGIHGIYADYDHIKLSELLIDNFYPIALGFLHIPAIYLLTIFCLYEMVWTRLRIFFRTSKFKRIFAFCLVINNCHLIPRKLRITLKKNVNHLYESIGYREIYVALKSK